MCSISLCIREINNTLIDIAKDIDLVMLMYNLIEYSDNYWKISGSLRQYYRDEAFLNNVGVIYDFPWNNLSLNFNKK